ncbi:hypothetical protein GBF38_013285, partial [Nibea albiflora]
MYRRSGMRGGESETAMKSPGTTVYYQDSSRGSAQASEPAGKNSDSQNALEDLAHYEFLAHLRKTSTSVSLLDHLNHNGTSAVYHPGSRHDELPPAIWSPGAQHRSPEGAG